MNIKYARMSTIYRLSSFHSRGYWTKPRTSNTVRMDQLGNIFSFPVFNIFLFCILYIGTKRRCDEQWGRGVQRPVLCVSSIKIHVRAAHGRVARPKPSSYGYLMRKWIVLPPSPQPFYQHDLAWALQSTYPTLVIVVNVGYTV
jgi:hypothetical protein